MTDEILKVLNATKERIQRSEYGQKSFEQTVDALIVAVEGIERAARHHSYIAGNMNKLSTMSLILSDVKKDIATTLGVRENDLMGISCKICGRHGHDASMCRPVYNGPSLREMDEKRKAKDTDRESKEIKLNIIRTWPNGFEKRLNDVWKDLEGFTASYKLHDLKLILEEFGFDLKVYEATCENKDREK